MTHILNATHNPLLFECVHLNIYPLYLNLYGLYFTEEAEGSRYDWLDLV